MRSWIALSAAGVLCLGGVAALRADDAAPQSSQDRSKQERELRDLEEQRAKTDARIRELRRQLGRGAAPRIELREQQRELSPEQREHVEKALEQARRSLEQAQKNMPDLKVVIPDIDKIVENSVRVFVGPDGKVQTFKGNMTPEQRDQFKKQMDEFRVQMRKHADEMRKPGEEMRRSFVFPREGFRVEPRERELRIQRTPRGDGDTRAELDRLRREIDRLRDEIDRQDRGGSAPKPKSDDHLVSPLDPYSPVI